MKTIQRPQHLLTSITIDAASAAFAIGCGSSSSSSSSSASPGAGGGSVSGKASVMAVWSGAEQKAFQQVIDGFESQ